MNAGLLLFLIVGTLIGLFWAGIQFWFPYYIFHPNYGSVERGPTSNSSTEYLNENPLTKENDVAVLTSLLNVDKQLHSLKGKIKVEGTARRIFYEQLGRIGVNKQQWGLVQNLIRDVTQQVYPQIIDLGGEAVPYLQSIAVNKEHILRPVALELLKDIQKETKGRLSKAPYLICPSCLIYCGENLIHLSLGRTITYYGCRACGQSREFKNWENRIIGILDSKSDLNGQTWERDILRVNWLTYRKLFDFDEVEIIRATDEEVERFVVQVGNDTDAIRTSIYAQMSCIVHPDCQLSENTLRILKRTFGRVEFKETTASR